jgi:hypothetical protein
MHLTVHMTGWLTRLLIRHGMDSEHSGMASSFKTTAPTDSSMLHSDSEICVCVACSRAASEPDLIACRAVDAKRDSFIVGDFVLGTSSLGSMDLAVVAAVKRLHWLTGSTAAGLQSKGKREKFAAVSPALTVSYQSKDGQIDDENLELLEFKEAIDRVSTIIQHHQPRD